jgi:competence/damage-inducible protein CinA-like protein
MKNVTAEIIAIGTEILLGEITDTNSVHMARNLRDIGVNIYYMTSVGDNKERIASAINIALQRADIVITCGGLGPTVDDMTRQAIAHATNRELIFHTSLFKQIEQRFATYRVKMSENNRRQAFLPAGALPIVNPVGTAPAFIVQDKDKHIISLPGVPREMKFLLQESVMPYIQKQYQLGVIKARILKTAGIGESALDELLGDALLNESNPSVGLAAHHGIIDIRLTAKAPNLDDANTLLRTVAEQVYQRAGQYIFGEDDADLVDTLLKELNDNKIILNIVEAGISTLQPLLQQKSDTSSITFNCYESPDALYAKTNESLKTSLRDVSQKIASESAISPQHASIVILSQPAVDENPDQDVGTVVAIALGQIVHSRVYGLGAKNPLTKQWVSRWALAFLWRMIRENN